MIQAARRSSAAEAGASTGKNDENSSGTRVPDEKMFRFNRDLSHALTLLSEIGDRADCMVEMLGALGSAVDIGEVKLILRGFEYQMMDIRDAANSAERIGAVA